MTSSNPFADDPWNGPGNSNYAGGDEDLNIQQIRQQQRRMIEGKQDDGVSSIRCI